MLLYYITDRKGFAGGEAQQRAAMLSKIADASRAGVDYIQLREKDLATRDLEHLAVESMRAVQANSNTAKLLINGRADVALASGADGVQLPAFELPASEIRVLWMKCSNRPPLIGVSAHSASEVRYAEAHGANFAVLAPIFEKILPKTKGIGIEALRDACANLAAPSNVEAPYKGHFAVIALGGVRLANASACLAAGATGIAGIRVFQDAEIAETVRRLRELESFIGRT